MSDEEILRLLNISTESTFYKKIVKFSIFERLFSISFFEIFRNRTLKFTVMQVYSCLCWLVSLPGCQVLLTVLQLKHLKIIGLVQSLAQLLVRLCFYLIQIRPNFKLFFRWKTQQSRCNVHRSSWRSDLDA